MTIHKTLPSLKIPTISINRSDLLKVESLVDACTIEFTVFAQVRKEGDHYHVYNPMVPEQRSHATTTEADSSGIVKLITENPDVDTDTIRMWMHSHVNMGVSPSHQDETEMLENSKHCDYFIGWIANKSNEHFLWLVDNTVGLFFKDIEFSVIEDESLIWDNPYDNVIQESESLLTVCDELLEKYPTDVNLISASAFLEANAAEIESARIVQDKILKLYDYLDALQEKLVDAEDEVLKSESKAIIDEKVKPFYAVKRYASDHYNPFINSSYLQNRQRKFNGYNSMNNSELTEDNWKEGDRWYLNQGFWQNEAWVERWGDVYGSV